MAALGTISNIYPIPADRPLPVYPISNYKIHRGLKLESIGVVDVSLVTPALHHPLAHYVIRQIRVIFKQLWPTHGQRFPQ